MLHPSGWTVEQVEAWRQGTWTKAAVDALERLADDHIDDCDECQERLEVDPSTLPPRERYWCPVGESLRETAGQAAVEFSWQPDFEP